MSAKYTILPLVICLTTLCLTAAPQADFPVTVVLYDQPDLKSSATQETVVTDIFASLKIYKFVNKTLSFVLLHGSCVEMHTKDPPENNPGDWYFTIDTKNKQVQAGFESRIASVKKCGSKPVELRCPAGKFVKKISWDTNKSLCEGIQLKCYKGTTGFEDETVLKSHESGTLENHDECPAFYGIDRTRSNRKGVEFEMTPQCKPGNVQPDLKVDIGTGKDIHGVDKDQIVYHSVDCKSDAIVGLILKVESNSGCIKSMEGICAPFK